MTKPPIGVIPKRIWEEHRVGDILCAIERYRRANKPIPQEWIVELFGLKHVGGFTFAVELDTEP